MNNIILDFRHNYVRGERLESQEIVYQYDSGRVIEAYVPTTEPSFFLHVGFANDETLSVITIDSVTEDQEEGGYKILATIPDSIIARYGDLLVYIVAAGNDQLVTTYEGFVPIRHKLAAEDYIVPDEEATDIIERSEVAADRAEVARAAADAKKTGDELTGLKNGLNNNITWKTSASLEKTGANNAVSLSGITYSELMIVVKIDNTTNIETFYVNKEILVFGGCWIRHGGYGATVATGAIVTIYVSTGAASITNVVLGTTDYGSTSVIKVYYR